MEAKMKMFTVLVVIFVWGLAVDVADAKLVGYWKFDEGSGGIAYDSSGNGHHGTITGAKWDKGKVGGALNFEGKGFVAIPPESFSTIQDQITLSLWQYGLPEQPAEDTLLSAGIGSSDSVITIHLPWSDGTVHYCTRGNEKIIKISTDPSKYKGMWNHWVFTKNAGSGEMKIFLNSKLWAVTSRKFAYLEGAKADSFAIGGNPDGSYCYFGLVDEVSIHDRELGPDEVAELYRHFSADDMSQSISMLEMLSDAVHKAEGLIKEQGSKKGIAFVEKAIAEYKQWQEKDQSSANPNHKILVSDLRLILERTKKQAGYPTNDLVGVCKRKIESGLYSWIIPGSALLGLYENISLDEYQNIIWKLLDEDKNYLLDIATKAKAMIGSREAKVAAGFLEANLAAYTRWQQKHPLDDVAAENALPMAYYQLAKAKETIGASKKDIADTYSKTFCHSRTTYVTEQTGALIWLLENDCTDQYTRLIKSLTQSYKFEKYFKDVVRNVCRHFESEKNLAKFERFLDTLLDKSKYPAEWAWFVRSRLKDRTNLWARLQRSLLQADQGLPGQRQPGRQRRELKTIL